MILPFPRLLLSTLFAFAIGICGVSAQDNGEKKVIKALLITGGSRPDLEEQKAIITEGISARCRFPIEWEIVHQGGTAGDVKIPLYDDENWAAGYDVVVHNECFPKVTDQEWVERILKPHREGVPAVLIHGTLISYPVKGGSWSDFCGAKIVESGAKHPFEVQVVKDDYPVTKPLNNWNSPSGELFLVSETSPPTRVLANYRFEKDGNLYPNVWAHKYGENKSKVFATTIGFGRESMMQNGYLNMLTAGFLWAIDKDIPENLMISRDPGESVLIPGRNLLTDQSSLSSSKDSDLAIDGDTSTTWHTDRGEIINWWEASLSDPSEMNAIVVIWDSDIKHPYWIEGSLDGRLWELIVRQSSPEGEKKTVAFHEISGRYRHLRISNPDTGILDGLVEVAAYQSLREVPSHLISAAYTPKKKSIQAGVVSQEIRDPILPVTAAFALLDDAGSAKKWAEACDALSRVRDPAVVDGLIARIRKTNSGKFRHLAIAALGSLYLGPEGKTWAKSPEIAAFLESLFPGKRVDKKLLLEVFLRAGIPVNDISAVTASLRGLPETRQLQLNLLERNRVPYSSMGFLTSIAKDEAESPENRFRAGVLLASSADMLAMRDAFELAAPAESDSKVVETLREKVLQNPTWEAQIEWLIGKTEAPEKREREFAWRVLITILEDPEARSSSKDLVEQALANSEMLAGPSFLSLIRVIFQSENPILRSIMERVMESENSLLSEAAAAALEGVKVVNREITLQEMSIEQIQNGVSLVEAPDTENGRLIVKKNCSQCHSKKGPQLTDLLNHDLFSDVLTPDKEIIEGFATFEMTMTDGNVYLGFIASETDNLLEVIDQAGNSALIEKGKIKQRQLASISTMPGNVVNHLSTKELADLFAYLKTL